MDRGKPRTGLSVVELLVVTAILGIVASMGLSALSRGKRISKDTVCLNDLKQVHLGLRLYYNAEKTCAPEDLGGPLAPYVARTGGTSMTTESARATRRPTDLFPAALPAANVARAARMARRPK